MTASPSAHRARLTANLGLTERVLAGPRTRRLLSAIEAGLDQVEDQLAAELKVSDSIVDATSRYLYEAGGKCVRPMLTLLTAQLGRGATTGFEPTRELTLLAGEAVYLLPWTLLGLVAAVFAGPPRTFFLALGLPVILLFNIVPLFGSEFWPSTTALRFLAGPASFGASAGIILQSADRVGRKFPLSVVAQLSEASILLADAEAWFSNIEEAAIAAQNGELTPDELDAALAGLPVPPVEAGEEVISDMVMWTARSDIFDIDPQSPQATLEQILAASWEAQSMQGQV